MTTLTSIFNAYAAEYIARYPPLPPAHRKTLQAICACRTGAYGYSLSTCQRCGPPHRLSPACGNRHCPQCQHHTARQWLHKQLHTQLPGPYFRIPCTIPATLRPCCRSHPRLAYQAMFQASSAALKRLARDARFLGTALPGFPGILHTWGRQLQYHPHLHSIVPGGGLAQDRAAWLPSRTNFYAPVKALSPIYRAIVKEEMRTAGLVEQIAPQGWHTAWNVHSQANPHGATSLQYLAPYVCKVAISNRRIVSLQDRMGTCTYRKPGSARPRTTHLDVLEFMRRFLQPVLPSGCMKVRHFGLLSTSCAITTEDIRRRMPTHHGRTPAVLATRHPPAAAWSCPHGGGEWLVVCRGWPSQVALLDTG